MIPIGTILHPCAASLNLISCSYRNFDKTNLWQGTTPEAVKTSQKYESDDTTSFLVQSGKRLHSFKRLKILHNFIRIRTQTNVKQSIARIVVHSFSGLTQSQRQR
jgi:hypothetical protein